MKVETPEYYIKLLLSIYLPQKPFELLLIDKKPKTRMGCYVINKQRIRIYTKYQPICPLEEIAIHEFAHHIHETEKRKNNNRRRERMHGPEFWRIYTALMAKAVINGVFNDPYIEDIILQK